MIMHEVTGPKLVLAALAVIAGLALGGITTAGASGVDESASLRFTSTGFTRSSLNPLISDDVPEVIVTSIIADGEKRTGADPTEFQMLRSQPVVWNNGSLGCPKPGEFYTQELVDGYWVVLSYQGQEFDYRVNSQGFFLLCEESTPPGIGLPGGRASDNPVQ